MGEAEQAALLCSAGLPHGYIGMPWAFLPADVRERLAALDPATVEAAREADEVAFLLPALLEDDEDDEREAILGGLRYYNREPPRVTLWDDLVSCMETAAVGMGIVMEQILRVIGRPVVLIAILGFIAGFLIGRSGGGR